MVIEIINLKLLKEDYETSTCGGQPSPHSAHLRGLESIEDPLPIEDPDNPQCNIYNLALKNLTGIDPHLFLFIFLPALIFESAFGTEYHKFKRQFGKILLLAGPVLLGCVFTTAAGMKYILQW